MDEIQKYMQDKNQQLQDIINLVTEFAVKYSFNVLGAVIILVVGFIIASQVAAMFIRFMAKKNLDLTLTKFVASVIKFIIILFALVMALDKLGITMTPFVAALSGAAFGASFAFQGPLMNYGAGLVIVLTRPFVIGDTITVAGCSGLVEDINLSMTTLRNEDKVKITIPNKHVVGEIIHNSKQYKVIDQKIGISYASDTRKACEIVLKVLAEHADVAQSPKPQAGILEFGESSINLAARYWVPTERYYQNVFAVNQAVFEALKAGGITIPFPQREVRVIGGQL
jgi:small conductance mechanosensitive channel